METNLKNKYKDNTPKQTIKNIQEFFKNFYENSCQIIEHSV